MHQCDMHQERAVIHEIPLPGHDWLTFRRLVLIVSSCFGLFSVFLSLFLVFMHATHYSKPWEQKHIIRILTMVPVYSILAWFLFFYYHDEVYFLVAPLVYEAITVVSFYMLMCHWVGPDLASQHEVFLHKTPPRWFVISLLGVRSPRSAVTWFNTTSAAVLQYVVLRPVLFLTAVITQATGYYCIESLSPGFAHLWVTVFSLISVSIAVWGLANFYAGTRDELAGHGAGAKFIVLKLVVFLTNVQFIIITLAASSGAITATPKISIQDFRVGLPAILTCLEMAIFAVFHIFAYSWRPYLISGDTAASYQGGILGWKAFLDAFNVLDIVQELIRAWQWVFTGKDRRMDKVERPEDDKKLGEDTASVQAKYD